MFEKNMRIAYLLDFYHDVLDEHTAAVMKSYYNDDLSLAEIFSLSNAILLYATNFDTTSNFND